MLHLRLFILSWEWPDFGPLTIRRYGRKKDTGKVKKNGAKRLGNLGEESKFATNFGDTT